MSLRQFFRPKKKTPPTSPKNAYRLIVNVVMMAANPSYLPQLKEDILQVLSKYVSVFHVNVSGA